MDGAFRPLPALYSQRANVLVPFGTKSLLMVQSEGRHAVSNDAGAAWTPVSGPKLGFSGNYVTDGTTVYAAGSESPGTTRVLELVSGTWADISAGLLDLNGTRLVGSGSDLYAVSNSSVHKRSGDSWTRVAQTDSSASYNYGTLAAAGAKLYRLGGGDSQLRVLDTATASPAWTALGPALPESGYELAISGDLAITTSSNSSYRLSLASPSSGWTKMDAQPLQFLRMLQVGSDLYRNVGLAGQLEILREGTWQAAGKGLVPFVEALARQDGQLIASGPAGLFRRPATDTSGEWGQVPLALYPASTQVEGAGSTILVVPDGGVAKELAPGGAGYMDIPVAGPAFLAGNRNAPVVITLAAGVPTLHAKKDGSWISLGTLNSIAETVFGSDEAGVYVDASAYRSPTSAGQSKSLEIRVHPMGSGSWSPAAPALPIGSNEYPAALARAAGMTYALISSYDSSAGSSTYALKKSAKADAAWVSQALPKGPEGYYTASVFGRGSALFLSYYKSDSGGQKLTIYRLGNDSWIELGSVTDLGSGYYGRDVAAADAKYLYIGGETKAGKGGVWRAPLAGQGSFTAFGTGLPATVSRVSSLVIDGSSRTLFVGTDAGSFMLP